MTCSKCLLYGADGLTAHFRKMLMQMDAGKLQQKNISCNISCYFVDIFVRLYS